jgi:hypothetical protein
MAVGQNKELERNYIDYEVPEELISGTQTVRYDIK